MFKGNASKPSTEMFIVDSWLAAPVALHAHRPGEESTYLLCRAASELGTAFQQRVLRRAKQILRHRCIGSLWYVMGRQASEPAGSVLLLQELVPLLDTGARLTLASPCSQGPVVFDWLASLLGHRRSEVDMGVRFYPDDLHPDRVPAAAAELRRAGSPRPLLGSRGSVEQLACA
ncbi:MAG TPA: hypothetical protein VJU61_02885 [Polyangiaceae bacterium]|nr:hypothetical protein [Polyangiaceae bacterium]